MTNIKKWGDLKTNLDDSYFVPEVERSRRVRPELCFIVLREVVDPVLARSSDPERAELYVVKTKKGDSEQEIVRARINGEKFTSAERMTGLNICRVLDNGKGAIISPDYLYNEITGGLEAALNPDTVTYGAAGVEKGDTFSIKSRVIEGYTYTTEPYNLLNKEQHNALYETGTMIKVQLKVKKGGEEEEEQGRGLYSHVNIEPPTKMVHFVRIEAPTKEMFLYVLHNILNTTTYFARSTRKGSMRNKIIGAIFSNSAIGLSSGELLKDYFASDVKNEYAPDEVVKKIKEYVDKHKNTFWKILWENDGGKTDKEFKEKLGPILDVALLKAEESREIMKECLEELTKQSKAAYMPQENAATQPPPSGSSEANQNSNGRKGAVKKSDKNKTR